MKTVEFNNMQKKVILLPKYFWPTTGGLQIATARIANTLSNIGWNVSIFFPEEPEYQPGLNLEDSRYKVFAIRGSRQEFWNNLNNILDQDIKGSSVLAIGLERGDTVGMQLNALYKLRQAGAKTFLRVTTTNDIALRINKTQASVLSQLDGLVVLNRIMEKEAEKKIRKDTFIHRIPVMVDINKYKPNKINYSKMREIKGIQKDIPVVLYIGRLDPRKRIELIIKAMAGVDALLWIVGDPTMGPDIKETERYIQLAKNYGLKSMKIESQVPERKVVNILQAADIFVTASNREGMSNAVLEASSVGLGIASFAIPGIIEIAEAFNKDGFYLAHPNSEYKGLRHAIQRALKYSEKNWRLSRENNLFFFSSKNIGAFWDRILSDKQVISPGKTEPPG